jgi:hypothetical protein
MYEKMTVEGEFSLVEGSDSPVGQVEFRTLVCLSQLSKSIGSQYLDVARVNV